ncbi:MAG: ATP synthase subunit B [Thermodesulfovibrionia bacterium]
MSLFDIIQKALFAGLGAQEKVKEFVDELVKKGELSESQGARLIKEWSEKARGTEEEFDKNIRELINKAIEKVNFPTRKEIDELNDKVKALTKRVKRLEESLVEKEKGG